MSSSVLHYNGSASWDSNPDGQEPCDTQLPLYPYSDDSSDRELYGPGQINYSHDHRNSIISSITPNGISDDDDASPSCSNPIDVPMAPRIHRNESLIEDASTCSIKQVTEDVDKSAKSSRKPPVDDPRASKKVKLIFEKHHDASEALSKDTGLKSK